MVSVYQVRPLRQQLMSSPQFRVLYPQRSKRGPLSKHRHRLRRLTVLRLRRLLHNLLGANKLSSLRRTRFSHKLLRTKLRNLR